MNSYTHVIHPFEAVYDASSKILILGSFPSVASRNVNFYYGHPRNRFWGLVERLFICTLNSVDDKKRFLLSHHIALWDVIYSCDIVGSSDSSIRNVVVNDIGTLVKNSAVELIICNGKTARRLFDKYVKDVNVRVIDLPSTSPANAACSFDKLAEVWKIIVSP